MKNNVKEIRKLLVKYRNKLSTIPGYTSLCSKYSKPNKENFYLKKTAQSDLRYIKNVLKRQEIQQDPELKKSFEEINPFVEKEILINAKKQLPSSISIPSYMLPKPERKKQASILSKIVGKDEGVYFNEKTQTIFLKPGAAQKFLHLHEEQNVSIPRNL